MYMGLEGVVSFFFFSSRRRHTRLQGDWSSDVCSSDLLAEGKSEVQTVVAANQALRLTRYGGSKLIVGKGLYSYSSELYVERLINGVVSNGADAVTVNLRCVAAEICETPDRKSTRLNSSH